MGVGNGVAVAVGMTNGTCEAAGVIPIGGTGLEGPIGVDVIGPGPGDPHAAKAARAAIITAVINSRREGFIVSS
jgi:hypothetical protein